MRWAVPIAHAFRRLGCDVVVAGAESLEDSAVNTYGLRGYKRAGQDWTAPAAVAQHLADVLLSQGNTAFCKALVSEYLTGAPLSDMVTDLIPIAEEFEPDEVVRDCTEFGGLLAALHVGARVTNLDNGFARMLALHDEWIRGALLALCTEHRIAGDLPSPESETILTPAPRDFLLNDLPNFRIESYRADAPERAGEQLGAWVTKLPVDRPLVYVSLGSIITCAPGALTDLAVDLYSRIIEALRQIHCTAIVAVGRGNEIALRTPAEHIRVTGITPQPLLLRAGVDVFVTHGGRGALRDAQGVPMVITPICSDQQDNAERCVDLRLGVSLTPEASAREIADAITTVLKRPSYRDNARLWHRRALALPPLDSVLRRILSEEGRTS
jgi:N-glycosyltransferase